MFATILANAEGAAAASTGVFFGLSPADVGLIGALIAGAIAGFLGLRKGEEAKKIQPPEPQFAATLIDRAAIHALTEKVAEGVTTMAAQIDALRKVAGAIEGFTESSEARARDATKGAIDELADRIDIILAERERERERKTRAPRS